MDDHWIGLAAATIGVACALLGWGVEVRTRRRNGEPSGVRDVLINSPQGVERAAMAQAARVTLPAYVLVLTVLAATQVGSTAAGAVMGLAGLMYGSACGIAGWRMSR